VSLKPVTRAFLQLIVGTMKSDPWSHYLVRILRKHLRLRWALLTFSSPIQASYHLRGLLIFVNTQTVPPTLAKRHSKPHGRVVDEPSSSCNDHTGERDQAGDDSDGCTMKSHFIRKGQVISSSLRFKIFTPTLRLAKAKTGFESIWALQKQPSDLNSCRDWKCQETWKE